MLFDYPIRAFQDFISFFEHILFFGAAQINTFLDFAGIHFIKNNENLLWFLISFL